MFQLTLGGCDAFLQFVFPEMPFVSAAWGGGLSAESRARGGIHSRVCTCDEAFKDTTKSLWRSPSLWGSCCAISSEML